ncbi:MAG TPA: 16S rRNA (cytidine(1402)-2'-O)-methyltransferase [Kiritimatiellia bacterium]|nr:16S rRNA (cytidine(1402)-2'-O)-methyltransferase [Kiritimatiellia bacterium]HMO97477.1 16S rRNA (cytidine(1402)-2'-O)-methyltransferase [Kiritimatiellia bacterium]
MTENETITKPEALPPGLYLVGTPIGNLGDITLRALETLRAVEVILAEDTRISSRLLARYEIRKPLISHHKFNEARRADEVIRRIREGERVALVTDSGMPGVSDPGSRLVRACREAGVAVTAIPGPSALATAISLCGLDAEGYLFGGFLPHKSGARRRMLVRLAQPNIAIVLYESPYRLEKLLEEIREELGERTVFVGRELTKKFEECRTGTPEEIQAVYRGRTVRGELTVVIAPATSPTVPVDQKDITG